MEVKVATIHKKEMMIVKKHNRWYWFFLLPSLLGVMLFYTVPFLYSLYYALIDNMGDRHFVGFKNFIDTLANPLFQNAAWNTVKIVGGCVFLSMGLALLLALCLQKLKRGRILATLILLLPMVVPSGTIAYFWEIMFGQNGLWTKLLLQLGVAHETAVMGGWEFLVLVIIFLWKNVSYNVVLFWSGLNWIPKLYYEQMEMEGGGAWKQFTNIIWVYLAPTTFVVLLMSIVNSFKAFKEVYMLYGPYPTPEVYMLQHYMNNQFQSLNMQKLSSAAYILFLVLGILLLLVFYGQKKVTDNYE